MCIRDRPGRGWLLRAGGGYTGRANSALPLGDPGTTDESAVATVVRWYRDRGLTPLLQVPLPPRADWSDDPFAAGMLGQGWRLLTPTLVMTGRAEGLRDALSTGAAADVTIEESPALADEWLEVAKPRALARPEAARAVLSAPREQVFLLARDEGGEALGVARVALDDGWAGLFGVHVVPEHRRRGIGAALTAAAGRVAVDRGVVLAYLQVEEPNTGAVALYERAGGFAAVAEHEDVRLAEAVRALGEDRVLATDRVRVHTSSRLEGRTPGGFAGFLRDLLEEASAEG